MPHIQEELKARMKGCTSDGTFILTSITIDREVSTSGPKYTLFYSGNNDTRYYAVPKIMQHEHGGIIELYKGGPNKVEDYRKWANNYFIA